MFGRLFQTFSIGGLFCCVVACAADGPAGEIAVKLSDVPQPARDAIVAKAGNNRIRQIEQVADEGEINYDVEADRAGRSWSFTIGESGQLVSEEMTLAQIPAAARKAIRGRLGKSRVEGITKWMDEEEVTYEVSMVQQGRARDFTVNERGDLLSWQVFAEELSAELQSALKKAAGTGELREIYRITEEGEVSYEAEIRSNGRARTVTLDAKGAVLAEEEPVAVREAPAAVRKALEAEAIGGRLLSLHKTIEDGDIAYEAELLKAGKHKTLTLDREGKVVP